ncbi:uncharacterized protein LOC116250394 isoform X2 [Nymphaea colorata]|uniref:uncharacterized protein LOC116250394 isoform X2 n=1 Tax=Nymphaea colorata TaxID=210225 RepID=UPI00214EC42C|nr:uncharacterized protein LOC116250394 isoform X2 [Nymphaea colorata]
MDSKYSKVCCTPGVPFESMDFLSRNSVIQVFRSLAAANSHDPRKQVAFEENIIKKYATQLRVSQQDKDRTVIVDDNTSVPLWQTDDLKSWIWLQQTIHPELNLDRCFRKKWTLAKFFGGQSIWLWLKEIKRKRKEETRLRKAEVHAAISVAGVAAVLAAVAAENVRKKSNRGQHQQKRQGKDDEEEANNARDAVLASAAALVAAQCVEVAQTMGAKKDQLGSAIGSALTAKDVGDVITLTAAAATSLRGAATLRARTATRTRGARSADEIVQLLQYNTRSGIDSEARPQDTICFDFLKGTSVLACETQLNVVTRNGDTESSEDHQAQSVHRGQRKDHT